MPHQNKLFPNALVVSIKKTSIERVFGVFLMFISVKKKKKKKSQKKIIFNQYKKYDLFLEMIFQYFFFLKIILSYNKLNTKS